MGAKQSHDKYANLEQGGIPQNKQKIQGLSRFMSTQAEHDRQVAVHGWDQHDENMKNMQLLKGLFKKLDPTVMKATKDVRGEIQLSFKYDFRRHLLLVKVIKCRELRSKDMRSKMSDPYVKVNLVPDRNNHGDRKTAIFQQSNDPVFDEIFAFPLDELELVDLKMVVKVMDTDIFGRDDFLGEVLVDMNTFNFKTEPVHTAWYLLNMETDLDITGDLEVSVEFQLPESLFVTIHNASGLSARNENKSADAFVKVTVQGTSIVHHTQVKKDTLTPIWEETFEYEISLEELTTRCIIFHVVDQDTSSSNDSLGQVMIDLSTFDPERGLHGTYPLADLRNTERLRSKFGQTSTAQEFREALIAHASTMHPSFLFGKHQGKKMVNVSCRKAGAHGRIRIVDGIPVK